MKRTSRTKPKQLPARPKREGTQGLQAEYRFDYAAAEPNRFAGQMRAGSLAVVLDPDVARVFRDGESVNAVLRALMAAMPARSPRRSS